MFKSLVLMVGFFLALLPVSAGVLESRSDIPRPAPPPSQKELKDVIALSAKGHWTLLGTNWLITDGLLKDLKFPPESLHPFPLSLGFYEGQNTLIYSHGPATATTSALAVFDVSTANYRDIASLPNRVLVPSLSPDKHHLAFVTGSGRLEVVDIETKQIRGLASAWASNPSWSPDGSMIAFEKNREHDQGWGYSEVALVSLASGEITVLDKGRFPAWSPKGDLIAYTDVDGKQLRVTDPQGKQHRVLKKNWAAVKGPIEGPLVWSPDQEHLIFHRVHDDIYGEQHNKAYVLDIGSRVTKSLAKDETILAWR